MALEGPQLLDQTVVQFARPLALQQRLRFGTPAWELRPVAPDGVVQRRPTAEALSTAVDGAIVQAQYSSNPATALGALALITARLTTA
jgi:glycerol-3-phosphate O-acyltransferase